ncbi:hypothetical protein OSB04_008809 [Centaurea solstitialis]|uniref:Fe2OG dioxygenase domain-containing protein n=1 Tax=Centaurea solstitialis TaxID=347529 RepID=A0AA38TP79_9ASTR|nr:hypothetical protein OSB04_008809 [Centaurea solstitialis]
MTTWPDLLPEILNQIAGKFQFYEDFINFLSVCSSWRSASTNKEPIHHHLHLPSKFPMLMLSDSKDHDDDEDRRFLLSNGTIRNLRLPEAHGQRCVSSHGWLITTGGSEFYASLIHPLSGTQIDLPELYMFEEFYFDQDEWIYYGQSMRKAVLTSSNPNSFCVVIVWGKTLGFCRPGFDVSWTRITGDWEGDLFDITYHTMRKRLYVVTGMGSVYECDIFDGNSGSLALNRVSTFPLKEFGLPSFQWAYVVEWDRESLLIVTRERNYYKKRDYEYGRYGPYRTKKFECFLLGLEDEKWSKATSLGDKSVFLGFNSSFVVNAGGGVKGDCIYFTDDLYEPYRGLPAGGGVDAGVYRMCDSGIESIFESRESLDFRGSPPLWFLSIASSQDVTMKVLLYQDPWKFTSHGTLQDWTGQNRTGLDSTGQDKREGRDWTGLDGTGHDWTEQMSVLCLVSVVADGNTSDGGGGWWWSVVVEYVKMVGSGGGSCVDYENFGGAVRAWIQVELKDADLNFRNRQLSIYNPATEKLKEKVEEFFGCEYELFIEFTSLIRFVGSVLDLHIQHSGFGSKYHQSDSWSKGASIGWHSDDNRPYLKQRDYAAVCYLNSHGVDFGGGLFHFQDGEPKTFIPMAGDVLIYTADSRNVHSVEEVSSISYVQLMKKLQITNGERLTLTLWFSRDKSHDEDSKLISFLTKCPFNCSDPVQTTTYHCQPHRTCIGYKPYPTDAKKHSSSDFSDILLEPLHVVRGNELLDKDFANLSHLLQVVKFYHWKASELQRSEFKREPIKVVPISTSQLEDVCHLKAEFLKDEHLADTIFRCREDVEHDWVSFRGTVDIWEAYTNSLLNKISVHIYPSIPIIELQLQPTTNQTPMTTWPDLLPEILNQIAGKFQFYEDFINFLSVCSSWRSASTNKEPIHHHLHLPSKFPMLMLSDSKDHDDDEDRRFLLSNGTIRNLRLPEAHGQRCVSSHGWLITTGGSEFCASLIHPLSGAQIDLPELYMFEEFYFDQDEWIYYGQSMRKAVLTSSNPNSFRVVIVWGKTLGFCRPGFDVSWTRITGDWEGDLFDITYHTMRKRLYVVTGMGSVYECDIFDGNSGSLALNRVSTFPLKEFGLPSFQWAPLSEPSTGWISWIPGKVNVHLWRVSINRLPTLDNLSERGVRLQSVDCPLCHTTKENLEHLFVRRSSTKLVSASLSRWVDWWPLDVASIQGLWLKVLSTASDSHSKQVRKVLVAAFLWSMWLYRNGKVFNGKIKSEKDITGEIQYWAFVWIRSRFKYGNQLNWESWVCNPKNAFRACIHLASR